MNETNEERFQALYWKYNNLVIRVAFNRIHDYYQAQDICQEAFLKMFRSLDMSQSDEKIKAWLIVVADNLAKDLLKKGGKYHQADELDMGMAEEAGTGISTDKYFDEAVRKEFRYRILDDLYKVNREQYEIVLLICCLDMSITEAAERMHMTYDQISMKLHRAREWIRRNYGDEYFEIKY